MTRQAVVRRRTRPDRPCGPRRLRLEPLEDRCLPATGFLHGIAYVDVNLNNQFDPADRPMPLALLQLFRDGETTPFRETYSGADGYYLFGDVPPGSYRLIETPPEGYANQSAQGLSQIDPVTVPGGTTNRIDVQLLDPDRLSSTFQGLYASRVIPENGVRLFGEVPVGFLDGDGVAGQIHLNVTRPGLPPVDIRTFCADLEFASDWPTGPFTPYPLHGVYPARGLELGYLFNTYGIRNDLMGTDAAALQIALWEEMYDEPSADPWNTGNFEYVIRDPAIEARATFYLRDAAGKVGYAAYHMANDPAKQSFLGAATLNFGNRPQPAMIDAWKWNDLNGDGVWDRNEPGLPGWTIEAVRDGQVVARTVTMEDDPRTPEYNEEGLYWLELPAGTYTLREVPQAGWRQTYPGGAGTHTITLAPGEAYAAPRGQATLGNFGNTRLLGSISGWKWEDRSRNHLWDRGEQGLPDWTIFLDLNGNGMLDAGEPRTTTGANGQYRFPNLAAGPYRVCEVQNTFWETTYPEVVPPCFSVTLAAGQNLAGRFETTEPLNFGNFRFSMIDLWKWNDLNGDGRWDANERGLAGWVIELVQGGTVITRTVSMEDDPRTPEIDETGLCWLIAAPGTYQLREVMQPGWRQTYPGGGGTHTITVVYGQDIMGRYGFAEPPNFGNTRTSDAPGGGERPGPDYFALQDQAGREPASGRDGNALLIERLRSGREALPVLLEPAAFEGESAKAPATGPGRNDKIVQTPADSAAAVASRPNRAVLDWVFFQEELLLNTLVPAAW